MRRRRERLLDAYHDDREALTPRERARAEAWLETDAGARVRVEQVATLGRTVHAAWTQAPSAPSPEYFLAAIRSELRQIDAERSARRVPRLARWRAELRSLGAPVPFAALAACASLTVALALWPDRALRMTQSMSGPIAQLTDLRDAPAPAATSRAPAPPTPVEPSPESPSAVYDLAQEDAPLMVFENPDGSTVIWMLEGDDNVSRRLTPSDGLA